jgi:hypothetical protein
MWRIDGDGGVDAADGDVDDAKSLLDLSRTEDWCSSASFLSISLPEVKFLRFLVSTNLSSVCTG